MIINKTVNNLAEYLIAIDEIKKEFGTHYFWYRGVSKDKYELLPTLYRQNILNKRKEGAEDVLEIERTVFLDFKSKSFPYLDNGIEDMGIYQIMRHYGAPTRLLDWTESALIALFFAIYEIDKCDNPCVWIIDPLHFNNGMTSKNYIFHINENFVKKRILNQDRTDKNYKIPDEPIAFYPSNVNEKIISQQSCFVLFGRNMNSLDKIAESKEIKMGKIKLENKDIKRIKDDVYHLGIRYTSIFPGFEGIVKNLLYDLDLTT